MVHVKMGKYDIGPFSCSIPADHAGAAIQKDNGVISLQSVATGSATEFHTIRSVCGHGSPGTQDFKFYGIRCVQNPTSE